METDTPAAPEQTRPPRDNLFRAVFPDGSGAVTRAIDLVRAEEDGQAEGPVMTGHFARFNEWTEIDSIFEGHFMERFAPGSLKKTLRDNRDNMRVLFQHGQDPQVGGKPLGAIRELREDDEGAYYEVPLLDARYVREDVLPGLEAGLYGSSFRFSILREEFVRAPGESEHNLKGLPERTVKEARAPEFGPVTFPAYAGATAGVRSLSDEFLLERFARYPDQLRELLEVLPSVRAIRSSADEPERAERRDNAPPKDGAGTQSHPDHAGRDQTPLFGLTAGKEKPSWLL